MAKEPGERSQRIIGVIWRPAGIVDGLRDERNGLTLWKGYNRVFKRLWLVSETEPNSKASGFTDREKALDYARLRNAQRGE